MVPTELPFLYMVNVIDAEEAVRALAEQLA
jgi:hypothetical protein